MPNHGTTFEGDHSPYRAMLGRMLRAYGRRVAEASPEDLAEFLTIKADVDEALSAAVAGLRAQGHSWGSIARGIGMSRQAAFKRWGQGEGDDPEIDAAIAQAEEAISTALARKAQREIEAGESRTHAREEFVPGYCVCGELDCPILAIAEAAQESAP